MIAGVGVDIIEIDRLQKLLSRPHADRFLRRVFTPGELSYCGAGGEHRVRRLAARFAAKEAALKALGLGLRQVRWIDVEVTRGEGGAPALALHGRLAEIAQERGVSRFHLSLSHSRDYAIAQVVAER